MSPIHALWGNIFKKRDGDDPGARQLLKSIPLFAGLGKGELREVARLVHRRVFRSGEVVFWEDEPGVGMYVVQKGEVGIYKEYSRAGQKELARLQSGDFFGEMALLEDDSRSATAVAHGETCLLALIHPELFDLFDRKPHLGVKLLAALANIMAQRLRKTSQDLQRLTRNSRPTKGGRPHSP